MRVLITCGPSYEPIDQVRRLTNLSTGTLGATLANAMTDAGHAVTCLRGEGSTYSGRLSAETVLSFGTNDDLSLLLKRLSSTSRFDVVLHAAALCDYRVAHVQNDQGETLSSPKIATRAGRVHLVLAPATKVLPSMRGWFPQARICGWKYELAGTREEAFSKAWAQINNCSTDACVLNGKAYGTGFALCLRGGEVRECADSQALSNELLKWAGPRDGAVTR